MSSPFHLTNKKYSRSQVLRKCKKCNDTSFELLENKKLTGRCCRCGEKYARNK